MNVNIVADVNAYLEGMRKAERVMKKQQRRELLANLIGIIGATIVVGYVLFSAWMIVVGRW